MPENLDEDLIEATIRRVAEAKAAQGNARQDADETSPMGSADEPGDDEVARTTERLQAATTAARNARPVAQPSAVSAPDEDAIAATIARVQAQKAAAEADGAKAAPQPEASDSAIEEPVQPVEAQAAAVSAQAQQEDEIEATIRRVQAQKAAQDAASHAEDRPAAHYESSPSHHTPSHEYEPHLETFEPVSEVSAADEALARIERAIRETYDAVASLTSRVEQLEQATTDEGRGHVTQFPSRQPQQERWQDEAPLVLQAGNGAPPRAPLAPHPSLRGALAEQLPQPEVIDARPLPKPLPPIQVESKRGLDLLPRTYRITVEDKRRGVDLVPLHRALLSMDGVRDMSLLSYNNGVAIVALETTGDLDSDELGKFVSRAMSRPARVEQHNEHTFVVKLAED